MSASSVEGDSALPEQGVAGDTMADLPLQDVKETTAQAAKAEDTGARSQEISFFGSLSLLVNNITGPALITLPIVFQDSGYLIPSLVLVLVTVISSLSCTMLCRAMSRLPGNEGFQGRHELISVAKYYFPRWAYLVTAILFLGSLQAANVAAIVETAKTMDLAILAVGNVTGALEFYPSPGFVATHAAFPPPFTGAYVLSAGFVLTMITTIPLGLANLDDNIVVQEVSFVIMLLIILEWFADFWMLGLHFDYVPAIGADLASVVGSVIFNYAFVTTVPSWVNEKRPDVSVNKTIWSSTLVSLGLYALIGYFGAATFRFHSDETLLDLLNDRSAGEVLHWITRISVYVFPVVVLMSGIPVVCIIIRYNLVQTELCGDKAAIFWSSVFPWLVAMVFYTGDGLMSIIVWSSILFNGVINFIIPICLYIVSERSAARGMHVPLELTSLGELDAYPDDDEEPKDVLIAASPQQEITVLPSWLPSIPTAIVCVTLVAALCGIGIFFKVLALISPPHISHASKRFSRLFGARR